MLRSIVTAAAVAALVLGTAVALPERADAADCAPAGGAAEPFEPAAGFDPSPYALVLTGGGWGHGVGMSQYGAKGAGLLGCSHADIIRAYYPGSDVATSDAYRAPTVRVGLTNLKEQESGGTRVTVKAEDEPVEWRIECLPESDPATCVEPVPEQPAGRTWWVRALRTEEAEKYPSPNAVADGAYIIIDVTDPEKSNHTVVWRGGDRFALLKVLHSGKVIRIGTNKGTVRRTRWGFLQLDSLADGDGKLFAVQHITSSDGSAGIDRYLWGLAEVPTSWPVETLEAQVVAARSYALQRIGLTSRESACRCDLYATTVDQHYTGWDHEERDRANGGRWKAAVDATAGQAAVYDGTIIDAFYSSSHGGSSEASAHIWGGEVPYLQAVDTSRWETVQGVDNPFQRWTVGFTEAQLETLFGFAEFVDFEVVTRGPGGHPTRKDLNGDGEPDGVRVTGRDGSGREIVRWYSSESIRSKMSLRSGYITVNHVEGDAAPSPSPSPSPTASPSPTPTASAYPADGTIDRGCPPEDVPEDGFNDVPAGSVHEPAVDCVVWWEVAAGKNETQYFPAEPVRRDQMATFIAQALEGAGFDLPADPDDHFSDDDGNVHEHHIDQLAEIGLVAGKADRAATYAPLEPVSRAQMATFLVRAYEADSGEELAAGRDWFTDDDGSVHEHAINAARTAGFTTGRDDDSYAPSDAVARAQMASFIARMLDRLVHFGHASPPS